MSTDNDEAGLQTATERVKKYADETHALGGTLADTLPTLRGEADELAARRPHPDPHLYDVEDGLRYRAAYVETVLDEWYYRSEGDL